VEYVRRNLGLLLAGIAYAVLSCYFIWQDQIWYTLFPFALIAVYYAIYQTEWAFLSLALFTPLSINIEEYTQSFGLFIPTEPLLFGFMLLLILMQIQRPIVPKALWKNPLIWAISFYLFWVFVTSISSSDPVASLKFLLARLWFLIPMLLLGTYVFRDKINISRFFWLFSIGMIVAITYTLIVHAGYRFGEKESHWVMWPFFKDHTIYGAIVALVIPLIFGLYFSKKHTPLIQATLLAFMGISLLGLYFSYTRAAWLSIIAALGVWALIRFNVKFSILAAVAAFAGAVLFFSWDSIQMELERNKSEHTTEEFGERLQSATNVSTDASNLERINRWSCAIAMFEDFGNLGNAHSEFLGPLAEMGLIGLLSICLIIAAIFYKAITLYNRWPAEDKEIRVLLIAMILSLTTYFVHGVLNNFLDTDKAAVPIWGMCAMIMALEISLDSKSKEVMS